LDISQVWFRKKNAGLYAIEALYLIVDRYTVHLNEKSLFALPPSILLESSHSDCLSCKKRLFSLKSKTRTIETMATGPMIVREKITICHSCGTHYRPTCLEERVSPGCKFGFDVISHVGMKMFLEYKTDREIVAGLKKKNISISRSQVAELGKQFIVYLALLHKKRLPQIKELLFFLGKYILHLDGTNAGAGAHLIAAMDGIKEIVLGSVKTRSENTLELVPFLENLKEAYGTPLAAVHDMSPAIIAAIEAVFPGVIDLVCHFHFLRGLGGDLLNYEYMRIKGILSTYKTECSLKNMVKEMREMIKTYKAEPELEAYLKKQQKGQSSKLTCPLLIAYTVGNWILDYENVSNGYGYPFDKSLFVFCGRLKTAQTHLQGLSAEMQLNGHIAKLESCISAVLGDESFCKLLPHLQTKIEYFERLREALRIAPLDGKNGLNDDGGNVDMQYIKKQVQAFINSKDVQKAAQTDDSISKMLKQINKYWDKLFADPIAIVTKTGEKVLVYPQRTNNILEQLFRYLLRVHCKRAGYSKMSRYLQTVIAEAPMIKNLLNPEYMEILLDGKTLAERFAEIDKDLVLEAVIKDKGQEAKMTPTMGKVLREPDFSIALLAG